MKRPHTRSSVTLGLLAASIASRIIAAEPSQAVLKAEARVPEARARKIALARVQRGTIKSSELERERGRLIWSFDIATPKSLNITEVQVDAKTGDVVSTAIETPAEQAEEAAGDRKVKR